MTDPRRRAKVEAWRASPLLFFAELCPWLVFRDWQAAELRAIAAGARTLAYVAARGGGKSFLNGCLTIWFLAVHADSVVLVTAGVARQLEGVIEECRYIWANSPRLRAMYPSWEIQNGAILTSEPGWRAIFATASQPALLEGFHSRGPSLIVIDEARSVSDPTLTSLMGTLTSPGSMLVAASVGGKREGFLYRAVTGAEPGVWDSVHVYGAKDLPFLKERYEAEVRRLGHDAPEIATQWEGRFLEYSEFSIFPEELCESVVGLDPNDDYSPRHRMAGWDCAGLGDDDSVLSLMVGARLDSFAVLPPIDLMAQVGLAIGWVHGNRVENVGVDAIGLGQGIYSRLAEQLSGPGASCRHGHRVVSFVASRAARDSERFHSQKSEIVMGLRKMMENREIGFPARNRSGHVERLIRELGSLKLVATQRGASRIEDPRDSPDFADSLIANLSMRGDVRAPGVVAFTPDFLR